MTTEISTSQVLGACMSALISTRDVTPHRDGVLVELMRRDLTDDELDTDAWCLDATLERHGLRVTRIARHPDGRLGFIVGRTR